MNAKSNLQYYAHRIATEIGSAYDIAHMFKYDYSNVKKFMKDPTKMPIKIALDLIDYSNARLVVFRDL